jgi:hypothetical protein
MVEEVLELVHLGLGGDAMEGDGKVGAAAGPVRGEVQRVLPISVRVHNNLRGTVKVVSDLLCFLICFNK